MLMKIGKQAKVYLWENKFLAQFVLIVCSDIDKNLTSKYAHIEK